MLTIVLFFFPVGLLLGALALERLERVLTAPQHDDRARRTPADAVDRSPERRSRRIRLAPAWPSSR
jgi:hypothetical protein